MTKTKPFPRSRSQSIYQFLLVTGMGLLVFVLFSHYFPILNKPFDIIGRVLLTAIFVVFAFISCRNQRLEPYRTILSAYAVALVAISVDYYLGLSRWLIPWFDIPAESPQGYAIDKLESSLLSVVCIILLARASGRSIQSLFIRKGRFVRGLTIGIIAFLVMTASVIPVSQSLFGGTNVTWARILPWTPWILIFVLANAFNEELLFRGLFLGELEPHIGRFGANLAMTIPFVLMHTGVEYTADILVFTAVLLPLSLAWGYVMQKTQSVWGSFLFHAAMDIPIMVGIFSNLS